MITHTYKNMQSKELELFALLVTNRLENNLIFNLIKVLALVDLVPALKALSAAILDYDTYGGGVARSDLRESCRLAVVQQLYFSSVKVEDLAKSNPDVIMASGYVLRKTTRSTTNKKELASVEAPSNFKVIDVDKKPGVVRLQWSASKGARNYGIEKRVRKSDAVWQSAGHTTNTYIELSGFDSDSVMEYRVCTYGMGETKSDFTPAVGVLVT